MQTSTIEATWRGIDGRAQEGWYDVRLTHRLVDAAGETILPAGRIAAGRLSEREDEPSVTLTVPAADVDDTAEWFLVVYISFEERRTSETYVIEPVAAGEVVDLALRVPVADLPDGFASGTVVRGIDGKDGRGIESVDLDGDALVFTYDDGTLEFVTVEGGFGGGDDTEPGAPGRGIESLTQVDEVTLVVTFTDETTQTLTLPRGADGDDADPLTITGDHLDEAGDVVLTFSDGSEVVVPGGRDAAPLTVDGYTFDEGGHTVVTFSDGSEAVVQRGGDGSDGDDADPLTVTGQRLTDDGNTVVIFSDGTEVTVPGGSDGTDGASLTVEHVQEVTGGLRVTFSDNTSMTVPRGPAGRDADALTVTGSTATAAGVRVAFSDGSEVVVPRGPAGDDGATPHVGPGGNWWVGDTNTGVRARGPAGESFTYADFTPEQLEALRGPRGYAGRGVESITDEDGDGVATVTYSDGETADLPLPAGGGGDGIGDIIEGVPNSMVGEIIMAMTQSIPAPVDYTDAAPTFYNVFETPEVGTPVLITFHNTQEVEAKMRVNSVNPPGGGAPTEGEIVTIPPLTTLPYRAEAVMVESYDYEGNVQHTPEVNAKRASYDNPGAVVTLQVMQ